MSEYYVNIPLLGWLLILWTLFLLAFVSCLVIRYCRGYTGAVDAWLDTCPWCLRWLLGVWPW